LDKKTRTPATSWTADPLLLEFKGDLPLSRTQEPLFARLPAKICGLDNNKRISGRLVVQTSDIRANKTFPVHLRLTAITVSFTK
jgi:hypothetical protein